MSPDRDPGRLGDDDHKMDERDDDSPRSIFSALWFRALLTLLVLGVLAAVAIPYVLDFATTPRLAATPAKSAAVTPAPQVTAAPAEEPAAPAATAPTSAAPSSPAATPAAPETPTARPAKSTATTPAAAKSRTVVAKAVETPQPTPAKGTEPEKPAPKVAEATQPSPAKAASGASGGPYWVQVGAFKDPETAKRLAARLREQGLRVEESTTTAPSSRAAVPPAAAPRPADRYDVVVSGASAADVDAKLAPKGLKGEATANGVVVRPSLALREAVTLSRDLADAGLSVQVRRIGPAPAPTPTTPAASPPTLHRVRVGGFPDRAAAVEAMKRLEDKGLKPFLTRGSQ